MVIYYTDDYYNYLTSKRNRRIAMRMWFLVVEPFLVTFQCAQYVGNSMCGHSKPCLYLKGTLFIRVNSFR